MTTDLKYTQGADNHGEEREVKNQQRDDEDEEFDSEVGDNKEEDECVDVVCGDQSTEPLHASPRRPVDEVLLDLQQGVKGELNHLMEAEINESLEQQIHCKEYLLDIRDNPADSHLLLQGQLIWISHNNFIIVIIIVPSCRRHDR